MNGLIQQNSLLFYFSSMENNQPLTERQMAVHIPVKSWCVLLLVIAFVKNATAKLVPLSGE
jgi:hypothetical protein